MVAQSDAPSTEQQSAPVVSAKAVRQMQQRFRQGLKALVAEVVGDDADPALAQALFHYAYRLRHARQKVTRSALMDVRHKSSSEIMELALDQPQAFPLRESSSMIRLAKGAHKTRHGHMFADGEWRRYYTMPAPDAQNLGRLGRQIVTWLEDQGYGNIDYIAGTCTDDRKQTRRIGRLLPDPKKQAFAKDPERLGQNLKIVISRHPYDVIRMSTLRGWQSCMTRGGDYFEYIPKDVEAGSMVAYLVSENDPEILDPLARVALKPYHNSKGETIMMAGPAYGIAPAHFKATVQAIMEREYNAGLMGDFRMDKSIYTDAMETTENRRPANTDGWTTAQWLDYLGLEVEHKDGEQIIHGDIKLRGYDLTRLPDFSAYTVMGDVDISQNKLTSLAGSPRKVTGDFSAEKNQLANLIGGPVEVGKSYNVCNNRLTSLQGAPAIISQNFKASRNDLTSLEGGPEKVAGELELGYNLLTDLSFLPEMGSEETGPGQVYVRNNQLVSLKGCPKRLNAGLWVSSNTGLTDLQGGPEHVAGMLELTHCGLTRLTGAPRFVGGDFLADVNELVSLEGGPQTVRGRYSASRNPTLRSLHGVPSDVQNGIYLSRCELTRLEGLPERVECALFLDYNKLPNLKGCPRIIKGRLHVAANMMSSLDGMPELVDGHFDAPGNYLTSTRGMTGKITGNINLDRNQLVDLTDLPRHVHGELRLGSNHLTSTKGLPDCVEGDILLRDNPIVDASHLPAKINGGVDIRQAPALKHLPARLPENCGLIATDRGMLTQHSLPSPDYPPSPENRQDGPAMP